MLPESNKMNFTQCFCRIFQFGVKGKIENFISTAGASSLTKGDDKGNTAVHYAAGQPELLDKILLKANELGKQRNKMIAFRGNIFKL